jgi:hypothetical protein
MNKFNKSFRIIWRKPNSLFVASWIRGITIFNSEKEAQKQKEIFRKLFPFNTYLVETIP